MDNSVKINFYQIEKLFSRQNNRDNISTFLAIYTIKDKVSKPRMTKGPNSAVKKCMTPMLQKGWELFI